MNNQKILIIGKKPPPIGGVTIHIKRLCTELERRGFPFSFCLLSKDNLFNCLKEILSSEIIHYHACNPCVLLFFVLLCRIMGKIILFTYHGNVGVERGLRKSTLILSIRLSTCPIVLNQESFIIAGKLNKNTQLISAFIPPDVNSLSLDDESKKRITDFSIHYDIVFSTNASNVAFDPMGNEMYGISSLIKIFSEIPEYGLILSDPTGSYRKYLLEKLKLLPENILILDFPHDFLSVLSCTSVMIRATTSDGDSLSVKEALSLNKWVIASDCVIRPAGVITYKTGDQLDLFRVIRNIIPYSIPVIKDEIIDGTTELISLYNHLLAGEIK